MQPENSLFVWGPGLLHSTYCRTSTLQHLLQLCSSNPSHKLQSRGYCPMS